MFEELQICPYTGLRSFTEEESLYFKGRDNQIEEITRLLEANKFLMVTGASGDGKSSVVFAGLIPNARAGFFKAKYNNWLIADFRPERSPLTNFAGALTRQLKIQSAASVETEIRRGFSSLVELYRNSDYYVDESRSSWMNASDEERKKQKKGAANLLILVDQFEEFFTNPENFPNGAPSQDAQITVNVLLETARIALRDNLPIYVVCTMRSDFIGQCAAFRGLPEYIGFSQFFIPRLKRKQLQQVIEEPAILSGNSISRRLTERLIYDLTEGTDQLPILQHALLQIWIATGEGKHEMDLIHYAMVGGMPANELPSEDQPKFLEWYKSLPEYQRPSYKTTSLQNVLDIHANKLYESAVTEYNNRYPDEVLTTRQAKRIVALTFACLTKIDQDRAVRNRMTLQEVTNIINQPELNSKIVGRVLNLFRRQGNTFIRPFISETEEESDLTPETVLDITHESLIRNWQRLKKWAHKEFEYFETYLDFKKQLDRWIASKKSRGYLLPVGPLAYFESWKEECKPNKYWIYRYLESENDPNEKLQTSEKILNEANLYIKQSAKRHMITRAFMKYGPRKIGIAFTLLATLLLSGFYYSDALRKQNVSIINQIYSTAESYTNKTDNLMFFPEAKADWMLTALRHDSNRTLAILNKLTDPEIRSSLPIDCFRRLMTLNPKFKDCEVKSELIQLCVDNLSETRNDLSSRDFLDNLNDFTASIVYDWYYNREEKTEAALEKVILLTQTELKRILNEEPSSEYGLSDQMYKAIENINNFSVSRETDLGEFVTMISPFSSDLGKRNFNSYFSFGKYLDNGQTQLPHGGGYQMLAEMYSALGDVSHVWQCTDSILKYKSAASYFNFNSFNNHYNLFGYFLRYGDRELAQSFIEELNQHHRIDVFEFMQYFQDRTGSLNYFYGTNLGERHPNHPGMMNPVTGLLSDEDLDLFFDIYEQTLDNITDKDQRLFLLAVMYKNRAVQRNKYFHDTEALNTDLDTDAWLDQAFTYFDQIDEPYLGGSVPVLYRYYSDGIRRKTMVRKHYFLYPDFHQNGWTGTRYTTDYFFKYLKSKGFLERYYTGKPELELFLDWISAANEVFLGSWNSDEVYRTEPDIDISEIIYLQDYLKDHPQGPDLDLNLINILLANHHFEAGETAAGLSFYSEVEPGTFGISAARGEYLNTSFFYNEAVNLACHLSVQGRIGEVNDLVSNLKETQFKILSYLKIARNVYYSDFPENAFVFLDSAFNSIDRLSQAERDQGFNTSRRGFSIPYSLIETLTSIGGYELNDLADNYLKELYPNGALSKVSGNLRAGNYYQALKTLPSSNTFMEDLQYYETFLLSDSYNSDDPNWERSNNILNRFGLISNDYILFATN